MTGLDPITALGLACNILQIVELGCRTIEHIKTVYHGGYPNEELKENAVALGRLTDEVKTNIQPWGKGRDRILIESADKCSRAAQQITKEVLSLGTPKPANFWYAVKVAITTTWRRRHLDKLKERLDQAEKLMRSGLLAQLW